MIPECDIPAHVQTGGISWEPRLRKRNQRGAAARRFAHQRFGAMEPRLEIGRWLRLHDRDANARHDRNRSVSGAQAPQLRLHESHQLAHVSFVEDQPGPGNSIHLWQ